MIRTSISSVFLALAALQLAGAFEFSLPGGASAPSLLAEIGAVGMQVGVAPNAYNTLAEELRAKAVALQEEEQALSFRAAALEERERAARARDAAALRAATAALGLLLTVIIVDGYLDHRARRLGGAGLPAVA